MKEEHEYKKKPNWKNDTGSPDKYKEEYCIKIIEYFKLSPYEDKVSCTSYNEKTWAEKEYIKSRPVDFPTIEWFASSIDVCVDTLNERCRKYKEFSYAHRKAKQLQKEILIKNWLNWLYKEWFAKFVAINCFPDMQDKIVEDINQTIDFNLDGKSIRELEELRKQILSSKK